MGVRTGNIDIRLGFIGKIENYIRGNDKTSKIANDVAIRNCDILLTILFASVVLFFILPAAKLEDIVSLEKDKAEGLLVDYGFIGIWSVSTFLTSAWVLLFLVSSGIVKFLAPLEYLRRFTIYWFKDLDSHPLRAIAKVAATLIVIGAFMLKAARWGWTMV